MSVPTSFVLLDATALLHGFGPWVLLGMALVVFIESGVLFPFLPGDSLLVTAAILAPELGVPVWLIALVALVAAIAGDQTGFWLGHRFGRRFFKDDARVLSTARLEEASSFFHRYGGLSLVLGRFVPFVRTYVPLAAGVAGMRYRSFVGWNVLGAIGWVGSMTLVGVLLGGIPGIAHRIDAIMLVIVGISALPVVIAAFKRYLEGKRAKRAAQAGGEGGAA